MGHCICFGKCVHLEPAHEPALGANLMLGEPPKHMGPQGISTAELKPRQAKGQLGLSKGQRGPARQQELEKRGLPWVDRFLPSLGVLQVVQLIIPQWGHILLAPKPVPPRTPLHFLTGDPLKLPQRFQLHVPSLTWCPKQLGSTEPC